jgi:hypothetical protein
VTNLFHRQKFDSRSTFGKNYRDIILHNTDYSTPYKVPTGEEWRVPLIRDLIYIKDNRAALEHFTAEAITMFLEEACCT